MDRDSNPLREAVRAIMDDHDIQQDFPDGMSAVDVLTEMRERNPDAFPLCTVIDVADELRAIYGRQGGR